MKRTGKQKKYPEKKKEMARKVRKLKSRGVVIAIYIGEISYFEDEEFYGHRGEFEQKKDKAQADLQKEVESSEFTPLTYGENTEERKEANAKLEDKKKELSCRIELMMALWELREKLNAREDEFRKAGEEANRQEEVERIPTNDYRGWSGRKCPR